MLSSSRRAAPHAPRTCRFRSFSVFSRCFSQCFSPTFKTCTYMSSKPRRGNHVSRRTVHKVVVRRIPPTLDEAIFRKTVAAALPSTDYFCWHQGKVSYGPPFSQPCSCAADRLYGPSPRLTWQHDRCVQLGIEEREMVCSVPQFYFGPVGAGSIMYTVHRMWCPAIIFRHVVRLRSLSKDSTVSSSSTRRVGNACRSTCIWRPISVPPGLGMPSFCVATGGTRLDASTVCGIMQEE